MNSEMCLILDCIILNKLSWRYKTFVEYIFTSDNCDTKSGICLGLS